MFKQIHWATAKMILKKFAYITDPNYASGDVISVNEAYKNLKKTGTTQLLKTGAVIGYNQEGFYVSGYAMDKSDVFHLFI